jgi:hypothetical protein
MRSHALTSLGSLFLRSRFRIAGTGQRHHLPNAAHAAVDVVGAPSFPLALGDASANCNQLEASALLAALALVTLAGVGGSSDVAPGHASRART